MPPQPLPPVRFKAAIKFLKQHGEDALKGRKFGDRWRKPLVSRRKAADIRKRALVEGTYGSFCSETGTGWDFRWDKSGNIGARTLKPNTNWTRKLERREVRAVKIEKKMKTMPKDIDTYRQDFKNSKPENTWENYYKGVSKKSA
mmetsp:Transcript_26133/g.29893  ORF Transcript_26133/g.29893 Transcript_26133/m.29893 type:complete len:144 (+) Transcript_26133:262-693(+)|eukprot:CAMPEP_0194137720 /NCGR_PEP_ID=MMETSP0152-20130528/7573_1 /TAXON_ID=1049557 /ORGANISM="Thalassiothrix antarctica, Strain L6-D1" /LENGTH=143 /DNA_ID=CAMNT_0038834857 /DNA_START=211 /DNA_END=642 /DNA_ORIENTATION=+